MTTKNIYNSAKTRRISAHKFETGSMVVTINELRPVKRRLRNFGWFTLSPAVKVADAYAAQRAVETFSAKFFERPAISVICDTCPAQADGTKNDLIAAGWDLSNKGCEFCPECNL